MARALGFAASLISALLGLGVAALGLWLRFDDNGYTGCLRTIQWCCYGTGAFLFLTSLPGLIGACAKSRGLQRFSATGGLIASLALIALGTFVFVVSRNEGTGPLPNTFTLTRYSNWFQDKINEEWPSISSCLKSKGLCDGFPAGSKYSGSNVFAVGCCYPPSDCATTNSTDCKTYGVSATVRCYQCNSCKGAFAHELRNDWRLASYALWGAGGAVLLLHLFQMFCGLSKKKDATYDDKQYDVVPTGTTTATYAVPQSAPYSAAPVETTAPVVAAPVVTAAAPSAYETTPTTYSVPATTYSAPATTYDAPATTYSAPRAEASSYSVEAQEIPDVDVAAPTVKVSPP